MVCMGQSYYSIPPSSQEVGVRYTKDIPNSQSNPSLDWIRSTRWSHHFCIYDNLVALLHLSVNDKLCTHPTFRWELDTALIYLTPNPIKLDSEQCWPTHLSVGVRYTNSRRNSFIVCIFSNKVHLYLVYHISKSF